MSGRQHRGPSAAWIAVLLALSVACGAESSGMTAGELGQTANTGGSKADQCTAEYPANEPFDVGEGIDVAVAPNAGPGAGTPLRSVQTIAEECRAGGGAHCSPGEFISRSAALCIAEGDELFSPGEQSRRAGLMFAQAERVVWWSIELTYPSPSDPYCGRLLLIRVDAVSGSLLSRATLGYCA